MNICCLIDSLGPGGAQRQMSLLVRELIARGHHVNLILYHDLRHFSEEVESSGVAPMAIRTRTKIGRVLAIRRAIRRTDPDCIVSFLSGPNLIGIAASLGLPRVPIIVSERSLSVLEAPRKYRLRFTAYSLADVVVCNSQSQADFIGRRFSFLSRKLRVIRNSIDLNAFKPSASMHTSTKLRLIVGASVRPQKNTLRFLHGLHLLHEKHRGAFHVDWYGSRFYANGAPTKLSAFYHETLDLARKLGSRKYFTLHDTRSNFNELLRNYDAACLPSISEGCPNFVCEAMATGLPVVASNVSDVPAILGSSRFVFDPYKPEDIASKLGSLITMNALERRQLGSENRKRAEHLLHFRRFGDSFEQCLLEATGAS